MADDLNRKKRKEAMRVLKFVLFSASAGIIETIGGNYLAETLGWNAFLVTGLNMACNIVTEFLYQRFFVFGKTIDTNKRALKIEEKEAERKAAMTEQE